VSSDHYTVAEITWKSFHVPGLASQKAEGAHLVVDALGLRGE
jgi:hypothetical protein